MTPDYPAASAETIVSLDALFSTYGTKNPLDLRTVDIQRLLWSTDTDNELAHCKDRGHCRRHACPWCAHWNVRALRRELSELADPTTEALYVVLSTESSWSLAENFAALAETRALFHKRSWLTANSRSWIRTTEMTHRSGLWHSHDNYVIFGNLEQLNYLRDEIATRWTATAAAVKPVARIASPHAQYAEFCRNTEATLQYVAKGLLAGSSDPERYGRTPGDILNDYRLGDADAAEQWAEIMDLLGTGRAPRLVARGGTLRGRKT